VPYAAIADPYCYPGTTVLKNIPGLRDADALEQFEAISTAQRGEEPLPPGRLSVGHFRAIHRHLFQDVYRWAGRFRSVRISRGDSMFCYPENIELESARLFRKLKERDFLRGREQGQFAAECAHVLAELNAIHAFRDGNGRVQLAFVALLAARAGHPLNLAKLNPQEFLNAMIASFSGNERPLSAQIGELMAA
jgi:cell filamentation protein